METRSLPTKTLATIDKYLHFTVGSAVSPIPYYNNRHLRGRAKLRVQIGKGSPEDIADEVQNIATSQKINLQAIDSQTLKKVLVDNNIGVDCSGFVYHVLDLKNLAFPFAKSLLARLRAKMRPAENTSVASLAHEANSSRVALEDVQPGDIITMQNGDRDHILLIHEIQYRNNLPAILHYTHAIAWPSDGEYGHGVRQGTIEITDIFGPLTEQTWLEAGKTREENYTWKRGENSTTSLRRLLVI